MKYYNKYSRKLLLTLIISMLLASSCSPSTVATDHPPAIFVPSATQPVIENTSTPLPTQTIIVTPSFQPTPTLTIEEKCMKIENQVPPDLGLSGVWVVGETNPYLEDIETGNKFGIPLNGTNTLSSDFEGYSVSPNREWFAYIDQYIDDGIAANKRVLRIIDSSGKSLSLDFWSENFQWIIGWVDNNHIALELDKTSVSHQKIVILNPFTGDLKDITPAWIKNYHDRDPYWLPQIYFSPDVTRAVVPNREFELKDVQTGTTLFKGEYIQTLPYLAWSSDDSKLAIVDNGSSYLYIISKNEEIVKLEYDDFDAISRFGRVWWSPDGKKLLFDSGGLHVFDLEAGRITKFCFKDKVIWSRGNDPIWSPDNRFIIINVSQFSDSAGWVDLSVLIDIHEMGTYQLPRKSIYHKRLAWLVPP